MSEQILKALMRLFAIIAQVNSDGMNEESRSWVYSYLQKILNDEALKHYYQLFEHFLKIHQKDVDSNNEERIKQISSDSVKVLSICHQINEELQQKQKLLVFIQLLEFVSRKDIITNEELEFIKTVASSFYINEEEYENCKALILNSYRDVPNKENLLLVSNRSFPVDIEVKHLNNTGMEGVLIFLYIESTGTFIFKYFGEDNITLNGHHIVFKRSYLFEKGSSLRSPKMQPLYYCDVANFFFKVSVDKKLVITAEDVEFRFRNSENGIKSFSFSESSGQLVGIMGGSGVGKSTLLNLLIGNIKPNSGVITINGHDLHEESDLLKGIIGYIPQDDLLIEELTVFQNLYYSAKLCFANLSNEELTKKVHECLSELDLYEIRDLKVGNALNKFISGGQRKRLNLALEFIREPSILFIDEPTSGLSSKDSFIVMDMLKELALKGELIIANIHQPSSEIFKMFDKLIILDKGGYPIYYGNPIDAVVYFKTMSHHINAMESECLRCGNVNPEQIFDIIESKVVNEYGKITQERKFTSQNWSELYKLHILPKFTKHEHSETLPEKVLHIPGKIKQFMVFAKRDVLSKLTNKQYLLINFLEAPLLAGILGYFTKYIKQGPLGIESYKFSENDNLFAYIFMAVIVAMFLGLTVSAEEIIKDRKIRKREKFLNLSWASYVNSKVLILFVISAIQMLSFVLVGNLILEIKGMTFHYWLLLFSTACFSNMLGLNISSALNSVITIYILIPFILVPQLLFAGVIVPFNKLHSSIASYKYVPWLGEIMISRWSYEALAVQQFKKNDYTKLFYEDDRIKSEAGYYGETLITGSRILPSRMEKCLKNIENNRDTIETERQFRLLKNEFAKFERFSNKEKFKWIDKFNYQDYTEEVHSEAMKYLHEIGDRLVTLSSGALIKKDAIVQKLIKKFPNGNEDLIKFKHTYFNEKLNEILSNKSMDISSDGLSILGIHETEDELIQIKDPIYKYPVSGFGRAHFYAPVKRIGNQYIDTYWFNLGVIWFSIITLYIALLFNLFSFILKYIPDARFIIYLREMKEKKIKKKLNIWWS